MHEGMTIVFSRPRASETVFSRRVCPLCGGLKVPPKIPILIGIAPYLMLTLLCMIWDVAKKRTMLSMKLMMMPLTSNAIVPVAKT